MCLGPIFTAPILNSLGCHITLCKAYPSLGTVALQGYTRVLALYERTFSEFICGVALGAILRLLATENSEGNSYQSVHGVGVKPLQCYS